MADSTSSQKQEYILLKIAGYDAKKQTVYGVNIETGKTISIIKNHTQKQGFIRYLATESDHRHAPIGSTVAVYGVTPNLSYPDTFRAEWATTVSKNQADEIVIAAPATVSPVINLTNGKTQVKVRILDETPLHIDSVDEISDVSLLAVEFPTELSGIRGCIVRTGRLGSDEAYSNNIRLDHTRNISDQINNYINAPAFQEFKDIAQGNINEHSGYIEVVGYTDAINANYNDPKNDARRAKTPNFINSGPNGGPAFSYAAIVYNKQYKNITQLVPLPGLKQIKNVVGLVGSHSKVSPASLPYLVPKRISDVEPTNINIPPQYNEKKPLDVRKKTNKQGQFTSVQVTIDPSKIATYEHRLSGISSEEPFIVQSKDDDPNLFKGFYFKKGYLDHISSILSDVADTPALYTKEQSGKIFVLGRTDQEPFNSSLKALSVSENGVEDSSGAFLFPLENKDNVINGLGDLLGMRSDIPATVLTIPKVIEDNVKHASTASISFKDWHESRYGRSSIGIGSDQESVIAKAAASLGIDWNETKNNIDWPMLGERTTHGKNNAIPIDSKHSVYVNLAYDQTYGYDTPGLSINFQNMDTHRGEGFTVQLTKDTFDLYEQLVKNDNYIPKVSETPEQIAAHKEKIKQNNIIKFAKENAYKAANRKIAFKYSIGLKPLSEHKILQEKKIPEAIEMLGLKESFNPKYPGIKAALYDVYDVHGDYAGYQEIFEEKIVIAIDAKTGEEKLGNKLFNIGLSKKTAEGVAIGTHRVVGEISQVPHTILYTESYGNAISNTLATGHPSVICLDVGNIKNVISLMQKKHPNHNHIQVADNDTASIKKGNIGMLSALDNSYNLGVSIIQPMLSDINSNEKLSDTSDIYVHKGMELLAQNLQIIMESPADPFSYNVERLIYVADVALERQLILTLKSLEEEDGKMENEEIIVLATQLLQSRNDMFGDSDNFESSVIPEMLTSIYIDKLRSKYKGVSEPTYDEVSLPPIAESLEKKVVSEQPKAVTVVQRSVIEQQSNIISPYPVTVAVAQDPRQQGSHVTHITSPDGVYNDAIVSLLRSNEIPFHRKPDGETFTTDVKYSNLVNSALSSLTGAPELYSTRLITNGASTTSVVVRGNFGDSAIRNKMEVVSGKKYDSQNKGFVFESVNDYIFVKEALKHHFTTNNPIISEIEAVKFSEENADLRAGIFKIADLFNKPSSAIAQSHVYMRIHNPRLAAFQSPLLAALYGETREAVRSMDSFGQLDGNRKLDAVMHQLKRDILKFMGEHPELSVKYSQHLAGALSIIDAQQNLDPLPELINRSVSVVVEQESEVEVKAEETTTLAADVVSPEVESRSEDEALQLRISNYIEIPSTTTKLVSEEIEAAEVLASINAEATVDVTFNQQEDLVLSLIAEDEFVAEPENPATHIDIELEKRLTNLYDNAKTYVDAKFDEFEFEEALKEPGASHYDIAKGVFKRQQFIDDISQIPQSSLSEKFGKLERLTAKYLFISVKKQIINTRIEWMKTIFNDALKTDANYNAYGIASKFSQKNVSGLLNPYVDGYSKEDAEATGKKAAAYDKEMLADDLLTIGGQIDITTAAGFFKVIQADYHRKNGFDNAVEEIDYGIGTELAEFTRYISPITEGNVEYFIIDDIVDGYTKTSLMIEIEDVLTPVENVRIEHLFLKRYTNNSGFTEARSIAIGKERIYQAVHFDLTEGTKRTAYPTIAPDAVALVNRWLKTSKLELEATEIVEQVIIDAEYALQSDSVEINESELDQPENLPVKTEIELAPETIKVLPHNEAFKALFVDSVNASLSYGDFYSEVFKSTGTLFEKNPYMIDGELDKVAVKKALNEAGFKSPKAMYDRIATIDGESKNVAPSLSLRDTGLVSEYDPKYRLSETYTRIDELLQESGVIELSLAHQIINGSALEWVSNAISNILVHEILREDITQVSPKFLQETYSVDAIKLLLDVNSVNKHEYNNLNTLITQQKSIKNLEHMGLQGFMELDLETQEEISKEIGVSRIVGSPRDIAHAAFNRINDVKELSVLRNSQYSFIKAAVTIEKSGGKIPSGAVRQLNRLLNNETLYRPVILETIKQLEMKIVEQGVDNAYAHIEASNTNNIEQAKNRSQGTSELVLRTDGAKIALVEGSTDREELDFNAFKYQYYTGSNEANNLDITPAYYLKESIDLIKTNEPLSYSDLVNNGIYPANAIANAAMFADTEVYAQTGASILTEPNGGLATIHVANKQFIVSVLDGMEIEKALVMSEHEDYESALAYVLSSLPYAEYRFDNIVKDNTIETALNNIGLSKHAVEHVNSILISDPQASLNLATDIINKAKELNLTAVDTGDSTLDAQHILENTYRYARLNAIADFVNLGGGEYSPELKLLQHVLSKTALDIVQTSSTKTELDDTLETLMPDLSDEDLIDVQSAQIVAESITLLTQEELSEVDQLITAIEPSFEVPEVTVGEFIEDVNSDVSELDGSLHFVQAPSESELTTLAAELGSALNSVDNSEALEVLLDEYEDKTLNDLAIEAVSINNQIVSGLSVASEGNVVIGRIDDNVTFGYLVKNEQGLTLSPYRYQDIDISNYPEQLIASGFIENGKVQTLPLFALSLEEIISEINSDNGTQFSPSTTDIANYIEDSANQSISKDNAAAVILSKVASGNNISFDVYMNIYKTLSKLPENPQLLTPTESLLISNTTGDSGLLAASDWLDSQRIEIRNTLATHLFEAGQSAEMSYYGLKGIVSNVHNHFESRNVDDLASLLPINSVEIRSQLAGNITLNKLINDVDESTDVQALLTELVLLPEDIALVGGIIESGSVNTDGTVIEGGKWQDLPLEGETQSAMLSAEQVIQSTKGVRVYSRSDEVLFINTANELDLGLVAKDTYEVDAKIVVTDHEGRAVDTVKVVNTSSEIEHIQSMANKEIELLTIGQTIFIGEALNVEDLIGEKELSGADLLSVYLATNKFNNEIRKDIDLLSVPAGHEVILDNNEYALSLNDNLSSIKSVGKHATMAELRKAILVAKRSNIFEGVDIDENNGVEPTRDASIAPSETILSEVAEATSSRPEFGVLSDNKSAGSFRDHRVDENTDGGRISTEQPAIISEEHESEPYDPDRSDYASESVSLPSDGNRRGIDFTPNIKFIFDAELIVALTKPLTVKQTYDANIAAIKLSKTLSSENRTATHEEKRTLAQFRGWGGAKQIFSGNYQHTDKRTELAEWLTAEEYESARRSVLSAFYTSPHITKATWSILTRLGIKGGVGLEPSFGTGNFASTIPPELQSTSVLQGRELDTVTGEISGHIHGDLVKTAGFESTNFPSNHFDFSIGNIPFGDYKVYDKNHKDMSNNLIHDYFILKVLDKVKPGGFVPVLTSSGTMDKKSDKVRLEISKSADLVGAMRLPNSAFKDNSGTEALIDILVFQKRDPESAPSNTDWLNVSETELPLAFATHQTRQLMVNDYFINNKDMVIGNLIAKSSRFGFEVGVVSEEEERYQKAPDIVPLLSAAIERFPENIHFEYSPAPISFIQKKTSVELLKEHASQGNVGGYVINSKGNVAQLQLEVEFNSQTLESEEKLISVELELPKSKTERLAALISLKNSTIDHLNLMASTDASDIEITGSMAAMSSEYDAVVKKFKELNSRANKSIFKDDPESGVLLSLEHYNRQTKTATKADLFTERTVFPNKVFENIDDSQEAILISLAEHGRIIPEYVSQLTGKKWNDITNELSGRIFENPETGGWDSENAYLSGNVIEKLDAAEAAAAIDEKFLLNVDYLKDVIPETIPYFEIRAKLGSDWLPPTDIQDFIKFIVKGENEEASPTERSEFKVMKINGQWKTDISKSIISRYEGNTRTAFGTKEWDAGKLIDAALNNSPVKVTYTDAEGKRFTIPEPTAEAQAKFELIKESFKTWLWSRESRAVRLEGLYNRLRNAFVEPKFDGSKIQFNGLSPYLAGQEFTPRVNQCNAVMRYLTTGKCLFIHDVGVGKSFTLLASIMKGHEVGRHTKPILAVPKSVFPQMQSLALAHYPNAKILMLDAVKTTNPKDKAVIINKIAMNNWDIIILPHTVLPKLDVPLEFKLGLIEEELSQIEQSLLMLDDEGFGATSLLTRSQTKLENERAKLNRALEDNDTYDALNIAELGIDAIFVDEADEFVNLKKITTLGAIKGVGSAQSNRATALHRITEYLHREVKDAGVVLATGTDIRNNMADLYTLMRFTDPTLLEASKVMLFDDFVGSFGDIQTQFEIAPEGSGYIEVTRLNKFINIPELLMMYRQVADVVTAEQAGVKRPQIEEIHVKGEQCEYLEAYMGVLAHRAERSRNGSPVFENDNLLAITGGGRKSSLSMNMIENDIPYNLNSKVAQCITNVTQVYKDNIAMSPSQIIFSDMGVPNKDGRFDLYNQMKGKLIEGGIPEDKVVFARDFNTDIRKQDLQDQMNSGDIAVCIGSTENMGVGKNVQKRLAAIHDLSIPWRYRDMVQRLGRIERFGNLFPNAKRFIYITEDSFDLFILQKVMQKAQITLQAKLTPRDSVREFVDDVEPKHSDIMALGTSNPIIQQSIEMESKIIKLEIAEKSFHKSLVNLRSNKTEAVRILGYAENRVSNISKIIEAVEGKPVILGTQKMETEDHIQAVTKSLNKAIKASIKADGQRKFKVGSVGDADVVIEAKFNGSFEGSLEVKDFKEIIAYGGYLKPVIEAISMNILPYLDDNLNHANETIQGYTTKIENLNIQDTSSKFPQADELQECRSAFREIEVQKANLLNDAVEIVDPLERFESLITELKDSQVIGMKQNVDVKDLWEPDLEIKIEPVA
jgi:N12 class adenine-specific DNA methylase